MSETTPAGLLGTLIERWEHYKLVAGQASVELNEPDCTYAEAEAETWGKAKAELEAALATLPQHLKDCAVWLGSSSNPESEPLPCDCGASLSRLQEIAAAREIIGGCVTSLDVMNHGSKSANAVDLVWASVPWLIAEVKRLAASPPAQAQD